MPGLDERKRPERFVQWLAERRAWLLRIESEALCKQADDAHLESFRRAKASGLRLSKEFELAQLPQDPKKVLPQAEKRLAEMQKHGIPAYDFEVALRGFRLWWKEKLREVRSASGKEARKKQLA